MRECSTLSAPVDWHVTLDEYDAAKQKAASLGFAGNEGIEFICAKGVTRGPQTLHRQPDGSLKTCFDLITSPPTQYWINRRNALLDIVGSASGSDPQVGTQKSVPTDLGFDKWVSTRPEWSKDNSWVFFRDHDDVKDNNVLTQRVQVFGSCAIHAPVTMQHYLVAMHTKTRAKTLDMPLWLRKHASSKILDGIVFGNGVVASTVLRKILVPHAETAGPRSVHTFSPSHFPINMQQYGPGLIVSWRVASDFNTDPPSPGPHLGAAPVEDPDPRKADDRHAMLVIGHRTEGGKLRLLLQNWWRNKQFVEVDEAYFNSCNEYDVKFVTTPQTHFPPTVDVTGDAFAVCAADGAGISGIGEPTLTLSS